jgi:hypothetical protein
MTGFPVSGTLLRRIHPTISDNSLEPITKTTLEEAWHDRQAIRIGTVAILAFSRRRWEKVAEGRMRARFHAQDFYHLHGSKSPLPRFADPLPLRRNGRGQLETVPARLVQATISALVRRSATEAASVSNTPTVSSQPMQPSVIDWP